MSAAQASGETAAVKETGRTTDPVVRKCMTKVTVNGFAVLCLTGEGGLLKYIKGE